MSHKERVGISEYRVAEAPDVLVTYGLGSCLGITLYDPEAKVGGLAHTLLPAPRSGLENSRLTKFVESSIRIMADELCTMGGERQRIEAKIIGGANMFTSLHIAPEETIGNRNILSARETLAALGIALISEDVGGAYGRTVEFDLSTGKVLVRSVSQNNKCLEI